MLQNKYQIRRIINHCKRTKNKFMVSSLSAKKTICIKQKHVTCFVQSTLSSKEKWKEKTKGKKVVMFYIEKDLFGFFEQNHHCKCKNK